MKTSKLDFKWLDHFDGPVVSTPLTQEELLMMRAIIAAEKQKQADAEKKAANEKQS